MSRGDARNADLARAAMVVAAGGSLIGLTRQATDFQVGPAGQAILVVGAILIVGGLVVAIRTLMRRGGA